MKKLIAVIMCAAMLLAVCGCAAGPKGLRRVTLNEVTRSVFYAPLYVACTKGFFAQEGLEVDIATGGGSDASMTALLSGDADVALMGPETGIYVVNQGKAEHPVIIAQLTKRDGSFLMGREEDTDFSFEKLRGKSVIAGRPGGMPFMTLMYVLRKHGLEPGKDVEIISNIQFNLMGGAFDGGTGDYVTLFEPVASAFQAEGKGYMVTNLGLESGEVPYTTFMVRPEAIKSDPDFVTSFVRAIYRAQKWVWSAGDGQVAEAMREYFPDTSLETLAAVARSYRATDSWTAVPTMTEDSFLRLQEILDGSGELAAPVEFGELVDNSFGQAVIEELG